MVALHANIQLILTLYWKCTQTGSPKYLENKYTLYILITIHSYLEEISEQFVYLSFLVIIFRKVK